MAMIDPSHPLAKLLREDKRYKLDAYIFVFEALNYAHQTMGLGEPRAAEEESSKSSRRRGGSQETTETDPDTDERHLTGQQLCEAIRRYGHEQYGLLAKCVFNDWGVYSTGDFGEIVFNLIRIEQMRKTKDDSREDFDDVFDFDELTQAFKIEPPESN
jgi:uncharacterized repeat protein (TIGR04138 family)